MPLLNLGRYSAGIATSDADLLRAQKLRHHLFVDRDSDGQDHDAFDEIYTHVLIEDVVSGRLVCCFRLFVLTCGTDPKHSYTAQYYDLSPLLNLPGVLVEMGRFCVFPGLNDPNILRLAWGVLTRYVDEKKARMLIGCSSFEGVDSERYRDAFSVLNKRHLAPSRWRPGIKAASVIDFSRMLQQHVPDEKKAMANMPALLRTYLLMGGRVSDHAVVDRQLNTLHVFTGLEIASVPAVRQRLLRAIAHSLDDLPTAG